MRRQHGAAHRVAERGNANDLSGRVGRRYDLALLVDYRIGEAEICDVDQLDLLDVLERPAGEEMRRASEERAIARDDQRLVEIGDAGRPLIRRRRGECSSHQRTHCNG